MNMPSVRQFFDKETSSYTYILIDPSSKKSIIIDPVFSNRERDIDFISAMGLELIYTIETHLHADHITGGYELKKRTGAKFAISKAANLTCADILIEDQQVFAFGDSSLKAISAPGHTNCGMCFLTQDSIFTGDTLLIRKCGRTDFQDGNPKTLYQTVHKKIFSLPDETKIYPAHDYQGYSFSTVKEEKALNTRLKMSITENEFVDIMNSLNLPYPDRMDEALPRNKNCGREV